MYKCGEVQNKLLNPGMRSVAEGVGKAGVSSRESKAMVDGCLVDEQRRPVYPAGSGAGTKEPVATFPV